MCRYMKNIAFFIPAFFLIAIISSSSLTAHAEISINEYTTTYKVGDIIPITGTVAIPGEITIQVISPNGNMATVRQLSAETSQFAVNVTSGGPLFSQLGTYTVYASDTYAGIDHTTFALTTMSRQQLLQSPSVMSSGEGGPVGGSNSQLTTSSGNNAVTDDNSGGESQTGSQYFSSTLDLNFVALLAIVAIVVICLTMAAVIVVVGLNNGQFFGHTGAGEHSIDGLTKDIDKKEEVRRI